MRATAHIQNLSDPSNPAMYLPYEESAVRIDGSTVCSDVVALPWIIILRNFAKKSCHIKKFSTSALDSDRSGRAS